MSARSDLGARWQAAATAYAGRSRREKIVLGVAALAVVYVLADTLWLTPSLNALKTQGKALDQKRADLAQLNAQASALAEQTRQREAQLAAALAGAKQEVGEVSARLAEFERTLVPARRMADFLRGLMPGTAVEMVALKTLPPTPLVQRAAAGKEGDAAAAKAVAAKQPNLYKHGVEITLAGSYPALLDYLARLENSPQKVLWGRLDLRVEKHPRSEMKLVLYTLSLDPAWLSV